MLHNVIAIGRERERDWHDKEKMNGALGKL